MQRDNIYKDNKIFSGYYIKCNKNNTVINVQQFENGKFKSFAALTEVDSVLNAQFIRTDCETFIPCTAKQNKNAKYCDPITEDGIYKIGLFTGKKYIYDKNGLLDKIEVWKNGKYIGDAQID